jgi:hypothetical protein
MATYFCPLLSFPPPPRPKITSQSTAKTDVSVQTSIKFWCVNEGRHQNYGLVECGVLQLDWQQHLGGTYSFRLQDESVRAILYNYHKTSKHHSTVFQETECSYLVWGFHFMTLLNLLKPSGNFTYHQV